MALTDQQAEELDDLVTGLSSHTLSITGYKRLAFLTAVKKGWHDGITTSIPIADFLTHLHGEVSEAWEAWREKGNEKVTWHTPNPEAENAASVGMYPPDKPEGVWPEIIDVLIRIFHRAEFMGIDIEDMLDEKMAYNLTRSYRHGGKVT